MKTPAYYSARYLSGRDLLALLPWVPYGPVLDAGCGSGWLAATIAQHGLAVEALDIDAERVLQAHQHYGEQVNWQCADIRRFHLPHEHYAAIFCLNVLPFIPNDERPALIARLKRSVKPGVS